MNCIIVDDDEMARASLQMLCDKIDDLEVDRVFENGLDVLVWLKDHSTDVILLDIEMPDLTGMDLVKSVENLPQIVFITGHTQYALEAFEHQVTDFVPKPVKFDRLEKAIDRVREILDNVKKENQNEIFIKEEGRYVRVPLEDIHYIESLGDYVRIILNDKTHIVHSTLKNMDDKIVSDKFLRVHRSFIVNLSRIEDIKEYNLIIGDKTIPISRTQRPTLMSRVRTI